MNIINKIGQYRQSGRQWYQRAQNTISIITVHHTADRQTDDDVTALNTAYNAHKAQGWPGLAYHFFIPKSGNIYQINNFSDVTWHDTKNYDSIGIALDGYFHAPYNEEPTKEQLQSLKELLDWLCTQNPQFPATQGNVYAHRERAATACPGDLFYPKVKEYREKGGDVNWVVEAPVNDYENTIKMASQWKDLIWYLALGEPVDIMFDRVKTLLSGKDGYINQLQREKAEVETKLQNKIEELGRVREQLLEKDELYKKLDTRLNEALKEPIKLQGEIEALHKDKIALDDAWGKKYGTLQIEKTNLETEYLKQIGVLKDEITRLKNRIDQLLAGQIKYTVGESITLLYDAIKNKRF